MPSKCLEGHNIILCRLLKNTQLGDKTGHMNHYSPLKETVNDENEQKEGECFQFPWYWGAKGWGWAIYRGKVPIFHCSG